MPTDKRQRQKQARLERLEAERKAARRAASRRRLITGIAVGAGVFAVLALIAFLSGGNDDDATTTTTTTVDPTATTASTAPPADQPEVTVPAPPLPTELQSTDLTTGDGPEAVAGSEVTVDYVGVAASTGEQFDSSYAEEPRSFTLAPGSVIEGWVQGIPGMKVGGRRQLVIPPALGYGPDGNPPAIGPDETLVFIVDLVAVA